MKFNLVRHRDACCLLLVAVATVLTVGCSGRPRNVARKVTGKVTLGGQPLADARITFSPQEGSASSGSASVGVTDAEGKYNLIWSTQRGRRIEGAEVGEHTVTISTFRYGDPSAKPPKPDVPEKVPYKYREGAGKPKATVKHGTNEINFELEAGPVDPPQPKGKTKGKK